VRRHVLRVHVPPSVATGGGSGNVSHAGGGTIHSSTGNELGGAGALVVLDAHRIFTVPPQNNSTQSQTSADSTAKGKPPMHLASLIWVASPAVGSNRYGAAAGKADLDSPYAPEGYFASLFKRHLVPAVPGLEVLLIATRRMRVFGSDGRALPRERFSAAVDYALSAVARQEMRRPRKLLRAGDRITQGEAARQHFFDRFESDREKRERAARGGAGTGGGGGTGGGKKEKEKETEETEDDDEEAPPPKLMRRPLDDPMLRPVIVGGYGYLGAQRATRVMLATPDRLAGCAVASGFVDRSIIDDVRDEVVWRVGDRDTATELVEGNLNTPLLVTVGEQDDRISAYLARQSFDKGVARWNPNAHFRVTPGRGEFARDELALLLSFVGQVLGTESETLDSVRPMLSMHQHLRVLGTPLYERSARETTVEEAHALGQHYGFFRTPGGGKRIITRATRDGLREASGFATQGIDRVVRGARL
jgi:hypothetical protein